MQQLKTKKQAINETHLTVEDEPKVEKLKRHHDRQPKLAFLPYVKCAFAGFLSLFLLGCGVFSKLSVIAVAKCDDGSSAKRGRRYIMLVLILMVPQFSSFVSAAWGSIRKKNCPWPTNKAIFYCVLSSILELTGLSFFTMVALTCDGYSASELIAFMMFVSIIPTIYQTFKPKDEQTTSKRKVLSFFCGLSQLAGFVVVLVLTHGSNNRFALISLIAVSIAWLPKMRKLQSKPRLTQTETEDEDNNNEENLETLLTHPGNLLRLKTARRKATVISEGLKLILTPFVTYFISLLCGDVKFSDLKGGFEYLGSNHDTVFCYFLVNIFVSFFGSIIGFVGCSMAIQKITFALPITLMTPISFVIALGCEKAWWPSDWLFEGNVEITNMQLVVAVCVVIVAFLAQSLSTTYYIWRSQDFIMAKESQLFWLPSYNGVMLEQNLLLNRKNVMTDEYFVNQNKLAKDSCIFICTTMYHEADYEMEQLLHSIRRIDIARQASMRRIESHVWFDGAVKKNVLNSYVLQLISLVNKTLNVKVNGCTKLETPYGMELRWRLPGGMHFHIHLKDNQKVKNKKRWSQVMYMSYVLDFKIKQMGVLEEDTYILTTDADVKFDADSVEALLDRLIRDPGVGAVCGRTHPLGHGPLVWYQMFDYAIGHWFQKVANHVLGSVLCCPGCFSVYRAKALRDVLGLYSTTADHAVDFLTKDMGEDRWLCTLMVQAGWRLEYCAAAENFTYCPDNFDEFYKQRRRWVPSTLANLALLISESDITTKNNDAMSFLFILYQATNVFSTLISPATVILIMVGGLQYGWDWDPTACLIILLLITFGYGLICLYTSQDFQLLAAKVCTLLFSLLMSAAFIGLIIQIVQNPKGKDNASPKPVTTRPPFVPTQPTKQTPSPKAEEFALPNQISPDRFLSTKDILFEETFDANSNSTSKHEERSAFYELALSSWYIIALVLIYILAALCHPTEAGCVVHGVWYLLCLPSGYLFLIIYSICNLTDRSWGTRENKAKTGNEESLSTVIKDKLLWVFRGCKDPVTEPVAEPVRPVNENSSTSESSTEYDSPPPSEEIEGARGETSGESTKSESEGSSHGSEGSSDLFVPQSPTSPLLSSPSKPMKSALKRTSRPSSPSTFRFPGEDNKRSVHFQAKLPTFKSHMAVGEWLEGKMKSYTANFENNGYDDTSFICGMTDQDLNDIGIETRGHRKKLLREIEQLPMVELDNNVPDNVDKWLTDLGLHEYWLNFKANDYDNPKALEDLKVMSSADLEKLLHDDFEVLKKGHVKKLTLAVAKLQYPSSIERKIREARLDLSKVPAGNLKDDGDGTENDFWKKLRELRLLPESKAFGQYSELADKLADLRNSVLLLFMVANLIWIILIYSLTKKTDLIGVDGENPLGLAFLAVFGFIIVIQFLTMLWHRLVTLLHFLARAPFRAGATGMKGWAFNDGDLAPPPSEEDMKKVRERRLRRSRKWRNSREILQSGEFDKSGEYEKSGEHTPLINGKAGPSYHGATSRSTSHRTSARMSPLPI